jgi:hypothetical protein
MIDSYHYNIKYIISGPVIWIMHIIFGMFFIYVGYSSLHDIKFPDYIYIGFIVIGVLAILYHTLIILADDD